MFFTKTLYKLSTAKHIIIPHAEFRWISNLKVIFLKKNNSFLRESFTLLKNEVKKKKKHFVKENRENNGLTAKSKINIDTNNTSSSFVFLKNETESRKTS